MSKTASFYMKCDDFIKEIFMKLIPFPYGLKAFMLHYLDLFTLHIPSNSIMCKNG